MTPKEAIEELKDCIGEVCDCPVQHGEEERCMDDGWGHTCVFYSAVQVAIKSLEQAQQYYEVGYENGRREEHDRVLKILQEHFKGEE